MNNDQQVGALGDDIVIGIPPTRLSADKALVFAAWIVLLAEPNASVTFEATMDAMLNA